MLCCFIRLKSGVGGLRFYQHLDNSLVSLQLATGERFFHDFSLVASRPLIKIVTGRIFGSSPENPVSPGRNSGLLRGVVVVGEEVVLVRRREGDLAFPEALENVASLLLELKG